MTNKIRTVITTDMECDDMNSLIHLCLYLNDIDLVGIIYTASQYHFNGDGIHTLGEVTKHYRCQGKAAIEENIGYPKADINASNLKAYRPFEEGWIENLWQNEYASVYPQLLKHDSNYPSPEYLLSITKVGNIAFEGDVTKETEGSNYLKDLILDEDPRKLYIQSWGGANTIARSLLSIYEEYHDTKLWQEVYQKVTDKIVILGIQNGIGQDNTYQDYIVPIFPNLKVLCSTHIYGTFFAAKESPLDCIEMFQGEWLKENIKEGKGQLLAKYGLWNDGQTYQGEPERFQYGHHHHLNWGFDMIDNIAFDDYDFLGEGDSNTYLPLLPVGLKGLENNTYGTLLGTLYQDGTTPKDPIYDPLSGEKKYYQRFIKAYQEEFATRALWCIKEPNEVAHPPHITIKQDTFFAQPGETIPLQAILSDDNNYPLIYGWDLYEEGSTFDSKIGHPAVFDALSLNTSFTVPKNAQQNDIFNLILTVRQNCEHSITRYGQVIIQVK